jgi:hypothetical protein
MAWLNRPSSAGPASASSAATRTADIKVIMTHPVMCIVRRCVTPQPTS